MNPNYVAVAGIKAYGPQELKALMESWDQPKYRAAQIEKWLYTKSVKSFSNMTNLSASLRSRLAEELTLPYPEIIRRDISIDGTRKYLLRLSDGVLVETVGLPKEVPVSSLPSISGPICPESAQPLGAITASSGLARLNTLEANRLQSEQQAIDRRHPGKDRLTVCFSTQAGCGMGCLFCATGKEGLTRSLAPGEMVDQVNLVAEDFGLRVSNVVAMGQGEPFANYDATLSALRFMNSANALGIGARHITVSTCGLLPGIRRFSAEPEQFTLAISLHSAIQATRDHLMPAMTKHPLNQLRHSLISYTEKTGRRVSLEYALIDRINDSPEELDALQAFCSRLLCHVNLIPLNLIDATEWLPSPPGRVQDFTGKLSHAGIEVSVRKPRGADIMGACGQLKAQAVI
jgi:23S rRNA (adenine2503-C2)-methyltransferase